MPSCTESVGLTTTWSPFFKSGSYVYLRSQIAPYVDLLKVNDVIVDDGHELSLGPGDYAVARNHNAGVLNIEVKLHGSEHSWAQAPLWVLYLYFQQQRSGLLTKRVTAANDLSAELLTRRLGECDGGFRSARSLHTPPAH